MLDAARAGAEWAWTILYREMAPAVLGYLRAHAAEDAEDLLGEVFLQLVRDLPKFQGDERGLRAWVLKIAHHRLIDDRRRRARRPVEAAVPELLEARGPRGDAEQEGIAAVELAGVQRALAQLSVDQQSVLLLRILGDLTIEETARVMDKRPGAVKALQRRGLAALEKNLAGGA